jgi:hypothetical protein
MPHGWHDLPRSVEDTDAVEFQLHRLRNQLRGTEEPYRPVLAEPAPEDERPDPRDYRDL